MSIGDHMQITESKKEVNSGKSLFLLILFNSIVGIFIFLTIMVTYHYFQNNLLEATTSEGRFIMTEWEILRELKLVTDRQLIEKDQEISELRRQLIDLSQRNSDGNAMQELQRQLRLAEQEREVIVQQRLLSPTDIQDVPSRTPDPVNPTTLAPIVTNLPSRLDPEQNSLTRLLQSRIDTLESQRSEQLLFASLLENDINSLNNRINILQTDIGSLETRNNLLTEDINLQTTMIGSLENQIRVLNEHLQSSELQISLLEKNLDDVLAVVERIQAMSLPNKTDSPSLDLTLDLLETRLILRALVRQPEFAQEYPDLPERLEFYFSFLEESGFNQGQNRANTAVLALINDWVDIQE